MSELIKKLKEDRVGFTSAMTVANYGGVPKKVPIKIKSPQYLEAVKTAWLHGAVAVTETLLMSHNENEYTEIKELFGDIMLILHDNYNDLKNSKYLVGTMPAQSIVDMFEKFMSENKNKNEGIENI